MNPQKHNATTGHKQTGRKSTVLTAAISALLMAGTVAAASAAQDITAKEAEQINAELAPVVNPQANAEKVGSAPEDPAAAVGTRFTYQGTLRLSGDRAQGPYDFRFKLFSQSVGGAQLGPTLFRSNLPVTDGLFATELDFGQAPINGDDIFLQIEVRDGASTGAYTVLSPRQRINATPYAVRALVGGGSSPWTVSGSTISYTGGKVGIGTSSPVATTNIVSSVGEDPLRVQTGGDLISRLWVKSDGTTLFKGPVKQEVQYGGALKAAVLLICGGSAGDSAYIYRQYNGVGSSTITATSNGDGKCIIDFPFDVDNRFWSVSPVDITRKAGMCHREPGTSADKLSCSRWNTSDSYPLTGKLMVLVY